MNKKIKTIIYTILTTFTLVSCSDDKDPNDRELLANEIRDGSNRIIQIPEDPSNATVASVYSVATPFIIALELTDRVKSINIQKQFTNDDPVLASKSGLIGIGNVSLESIARYNPTCLIHRSNDADTVTSVTNLGIDVLTITVENISDVKTTLLNIGKYFGKEDRATYVINWIDDQFSYVSSIVATIPQERKVTALCMGGTIGRVAGNDMLQTWMIEQAGGIPVATQGLNHNWIDVGEEQCCIWNPEYIFCTSSAARNYTKDGLLAKESMSDVKAIKNNNVYDIPTKKNSWDMPGLTIALGTLYMLRTMYPEYLSQTDFQERIDQYYTFMFGETFDGEELGY